MIEITAAQCNLIIDSMTKGVILECTPLEVRVMNMAVNGIKLPKELVMAKSRLYKYTQQRFKK